MADVYTCRRLRASLTARRLLAKVTERFTRAVFDGPATSRPPDGRRPPRASTMRIRVFRSRPDFLLRMPQHFFGPIAMSTVLFSTIVGGAQFRYRLVNVVVSRPQMRMAFELSESDGAERQHSGGDSGEQQFLHDCDPSERKIEWCDSLARNLDFEIPSQGPFTRYGLQTQSSSPVLSRDGFPRRLSADMPRGITALPLPAG